MSTKYRVIVARDAVLVNSNSGFSQLPKSLLLKKTGRIIGFPGWGSVGGKNGKKGMAGITNKQKIRAFLAAVFSFVVSQPVL